MKTLSILIIGAGGHCKVLIETIRRQFGESAKILGITDADSSRHGKEVMGVKILGGDSIVVDHSPTQVTLVNAIGTVGKTDARRKVFETFKEKKYSFLTLIHPTSILPTGFTPMEGAQIMAGAILQPGAQVGMNTIINTGAIVDHDCQIGDHCHIAPGVTLSGSVQVGNGTHIGTGASVIQGVKIGENTVIGAGTLVLKDLPSHVTAIGVPAQVGKL